MKKVLLLLLFSTFLLAQSTPPIQWLHPKPFGISIGWLKAWNSQLIYGVGGAGNFLKSTNGGVTFTNNPNAGVPINANPALSGDLYCGYFFDQNNGIVGGISGLMKTTDGGVSFFQIGSTVIPSAATVRSVNFLNNNLGLACGTSSLKAAVTTDGGTNWTLIGNLPSTIFYTVLQLTPTKWIIGGSTSSSANIKITTEAGATWTAVAAGTSTIYNILFIDSLTAYASAGSGGNTWSIYTHIDIDSANTKWIGTDDGLMTYNQNPLSVDEQSPQQYTLMQNYPNPFNPTTTIAFELPMKGFVNITVFNILGEKVITLADGMFESGKHEVVFHATDLPSGIYLYRLQSGDFVRTEKMVLLR